MANLVHLDRERDRNSWNPHQAYRSDNENQLLHVDRSTSLSIEDNEKNEVLPSAGFLEGAGHRSESTTAARNSAMYTRWRSLDSRMLIMTNGPTRYGAFLKWNKRCKFAEQAGCPIEPEHPQTPPSMKVSDRCEVPPEVSMEDVAAGLSRRMKGTIGVVGNVEFKAGFWVGVETSYWENMMEVVKYFSCPNKHGVLVWPDCVVVGDFPEEDLSVSEDEM